MNKETEILNNIKMGKDRIFSPCHLKQQIQIFIEYHPNHILIVFYMKANANSIEEEYLG